MIEIYRRWIEIVFVIIPTNCNHRRGVSWGNRTLPFRAGVSGGRHHDHTLIDGFLRGLINYAACKYHVMVATQRNVKDANVVAFAVFDYPLDSTCDILFADTSLLTRLNQHDLCIRSQATVDAI